MPHFIDRNLDSPLQLVGLPLARLAAMGGFRRLAPKLGRLRRGRAAAPAVLLPGDVRRPRPGPGAGDLRRDHLHGLRRGRVLPRGRHARRAPRAGRGGAEARGRHSATAPRSRRSTCRTGGPAASSPATASASRPTSSSSTPTCPPPTPSCCRRSTRRGGCLDAALLAVGRRPARRLVGAVRRTRRITRSTSGRPGTRRSTRSSTDGRVMSDPSFLLTTPTRTDPSLAPAGRHTLLRAVPGAEPARGRVDWAAAARGLPRPDPRDAREARLLRLRRRHRGRAPGDARRLAGPGHGRRRAVRGRPHLRPDRAVPLPDARPPRSATWCSAGRTPSPASACRWCSCRAGWPPNGSPGRDEDRPMSARAELDAAGIEGAALRAGYAALPRDQRPARPDVLPGHAAAAARASGRSSTRCTASPATSTTSSTTWRPGSSRRRSAPTGSRSGARLPRRPRVGRDQRPGQPRRASTPSQRWQIPTSLLRRLPRLDADGPERHLLRHLRRPDPLHVGLGRGDRSADAAHPRPGRRGTCAGTCSSRTRSTSAPRSS